MKKRIIATGIEMTEAIKAYVDKKTDSLDKFLPEDESILASIEIGKSTAHHQKGEVFRAEINLHVPGNDLRAEAYDEDLYAAIDAARDEMAREIKKVKGRGETLFRRGARIIKNILRREDREE